jgi:hypothetical protein
MGAKDDFGSSGDEGLDGRQGLLDTGVIGDDHGSVLPLQWHVEVYAHKAALS